MPEEVTATAESSPAEEPQQQQPQETVTPPTNAEDYAEWRMTGKLPDNGRKPPKSEDSATSKKQTSDGDESESSPVSETGPPAGKRSAEKRINQLTAEREAYRKELEELKARSAGKQDAKTPESSSVPQAAQQDQTGRPKKPSQDEFQTWSAYEKAKDEYDEKLAEWKADQKIREYLQTQEQQARQTAMQQKLDQAKQRYGDEAEPIIKKTGVSFFENPNVHQAVKTAIGRSDVMVDALYVMGSDTAELESFTALATKDPLEALRKWFTVEGLVRAELGKNGKAETNGNAPRRDEDGKFISAKPPARIRHAPAPPTELGGNTSPPGDERDRAAASGDVRKFFSEGNRRDLARWKGQA